MGDGRVSQQVVESVESVPVDARVSQSIIELLSLTPAAGARVSQSVVEVVSIAPDVELPAGDTIGITWVEFTDRQANVHVYSKLALPDPIGYYHGFKDARVIDWGNVVRALSDRNGVFEGMSATAMLSDNDRYLRGLLEADATKYFINRPYVERMIDDPSRRAQLTPRTFFRGLVSRYKPVSPLKFSFEAEDVLSRKFSATQSKDQVPARLITVTDFPNAPTDAIGVPVPIIYGRLSDYSAEEVSVGSTLPLDDTIPAVSSVFCYDVAGGSIDGQVGAIVTAVIGGSEGPLSNPAGTYNTGTGRRVFWNSVPGAASYNIYIFQGDGGWGSWAPSTGGSAAWVRKTTHDNVTNDGTWGAATIADYAVEFDSLADGTDATAVTTAVVDQGHGVVPPIYVGTYDVSGTSYRKFLVAGHACQAIDEIYIDGTPVGLADAAQSGVGGIWLVPGYAGWDALFSDPFEDITGHRYTVIYGKAGNHGPDRGSGLIAADSAANDGARAGAPIALNLSGIESAGDGSGDLIRDVHLQYKHLMINWVLQTYESGAWLAAPFFEDAAVAQLDESTFDACSAIAQDRLGTRSVDGESDMVGYLGAGVIGLSGFLQARAVIALMNLSGDCDAGFNRRGQFIISMVNEEAALTGEVDLYDVNDILSESLDITDDLDSHFNAMPYFYGKDYSGRDETGWLGRDTLEDEPSQTNYDAVLTAPDLQLEFVREAATADDIVGRRLVRMKDPPRIAKFDVGMQGMNYELGDVRRLTHFGGVGSSGWVQQPVRLIRHEINPNTFRVTLTAMDLKQLLLAALILGDESTLPAAWTSASATQQSYGYLCDETTGQFSDGKPGKRLR